MVDIANRIADYATDSEPDGLNGETAPARADGRDHKGRFAKGNPGGPGRPPRASEANYLLAVTEVVSVDRLKWIVEEQAHRAQKGDLRAAEFILKLLLGTNPPSLSEVLAGMLRGGEHYAVSDKLERDESCDPGGASSRRQRAVELAETLGDPDPPDRPCGLPGEPDLEALAGQARAQAVMDVLAEFAAE